MMVNIIFTIVMCILVAMFVLVMLGIVTTMFEDTETFQAIDEKIARLLRKDERSKK